MIEWFLVVFSFSSFLTAVYSMSIAGTYPGSRVKLSTEDKRAYSCNLLIT